MDRTMYVSQANTQSELQLVNDGQHKSAYMAQCKTFPHLKRVEAAAYNWVKFFTEADPIAPSAVMVNLTKFIDIGVLELMAESPTTSAKTLQALAFNSSVKVRQAVADNPKTPIPTLMMLALDESIDVRFQMAENHNLPDAILRILSEDENPYVAQRAAMTLGRDR